MCGWHAWPMMNRKTTEFDGVWMTLCVVAGVVKRIIPAVASTNAVIAGQYSSSLSCLGGGRGGGVLSSFCHCGWGRKACQLKVIFSTVMSCVFSLIIVTHSIVGCFTLCLHYVSVY